MATQHIDDLHVSSNTIRCGSVAREIPLTETASREPRTLNHEGDAGRMSFPDAPEKTALNGAMQCQLLRQIAAHPDLSLNLQGFLSRLVMLADGEGRVTKSQAEIAPLVRLSERQTRTLIGFAVKAGVIIRSRRGGVGGGRICDLLAFSIEQPATGVILPLSTQPEANQTDANVPVAPVSEVATGNNQQPATGTILPEAMATGETLPVDKQHQRVIEHAGARADTNLKNTTLSQDNPETENLDQTPVGVFALEVDEPKRKRARAEAMLQRGSRLPPDWRPTPNGMHGAELVGITGDWLEALIENFVGYWSNVAGQKGLKLDWNRAWTHEIAKEVRAQRHKPRVTQFPTQRRNGPYRAGGIPRMANVG